MGKRKPADEHRVESFEIGGSKYVEAYYDKVTGRRRAGHYAQRHIHEVYVFKMDLTFLKAVTNTHRPPELLSEAKAIEARWLAYQRKKDANLRLSKKPKAP